MPLYDFRCPQCGLQFEVSRPRSEAGNPAQCPNDGTAAVRVWSPMTYIRSGGDTDVGGDSSFGLDSGHDHDHGHDHGPDSHMH